MATFSLFTASIASANDTATATPAPGSQSGYVNQGTPVNLTTATPPPNAVVVTPIGATPPAGFEDSSSWPQNYAGQPFSVAPIGEAGQDGWSWTNWTNLIVTLTDTVNQVVVLWDNWTDDSQDGYGVFSGNAGDTFVIPVTGGDGISQVDFFWTTATPSPTPTEPPATGTPTPCPKVKCVVVQLPPEKLVCQTRFGEAGKPQSVVALQTIDGQKLAEGKDWWKTFDATKGDITLHFASGDLRSTLFVATLTDGTTKQLQMDPTFGAVYNAGTPDEWFQSNCWRVDEQQGSGSVTVQTHDPSANPEPVCINKP